MVTHSNMERKAELDFMGEYVERAAAIVAAYMRQEPTIASREHAIGRFQVANDVIWSPEIYHRVRAVLDQLAAKAEET